MLTRKRVFPPRSTQVLRFDCADKRDAGAPWTAILQARSMTTSA